MESSTTLTKTVWGHLSGGSSPECPRCGGRLYLERDRWVPGRPFYWDCSLGCSRQFHLSGEPIRKPAPVVSVGGTLVRSLVPAAVV